MSLDLTKLEKTILRGGRIVARCPACAEEGSDRSGNHLSIEDNGRGAYRCIVDSTGKGGAHSKRIYALAGDHTTLKARSMPPTSNRKARPCLPSLRPLKVEEMALIASRRGWISFAGLQLLTRRGLLWYGEIFDDGRKWPSWIITDSTRRNAQARRLDGEVWHGISGAKAKSIPRSDASWPIGAPEISDRHMVLLCEGQPDFVAALLVAWWEDANIAPVCMTGSGPFINSAALPYFAGKHVRIAVHDDDAGRAAGKKWAHQLDIAGAGSLDWFKFEGIKKQDGLPVKDLADFATLLDLGTASHDLFFPDMRWRGHILKD